MGFIDALIEGIGNVLLFFVGIAFVGLGMVAAKYRRQ